MSDDDRTRFRFKCEGIEVELVGDGRFVERMYRRIMRDIASAREASNGVEKEAARSPTPGSGKRTVAEEQQPVLWVVRCSEWMRRVYMLNPGDVRRSPLEHCLDTDAVSSLYADREAFDALLPELVDDDRTLWAELTEAGHDKMSEQDPS